MRETPESFFYYLLWETITIPKGNDRGHSKNEKDWTIRSQAPKYAKQVYGEGSETYNEMEVRELAILSDPLRYSPSVYESKLSMCLFQLSVLFHYKFILVILLQKN